MAHKTKRTAKWLPELIDKHVTGGRDSNPVVGLKDHSRTVRRSRIGIANLKEAGVPGRLINLKAEPQPCPGIKQ